MPHDPGVERCTLSFDSIPGGRLVCPSSASSSPRSTSAAGPSGNRPNSVNSRASASSRPASAVRTSRGSFCPAVAERESWATANRIGVSGFFISCATCRATSRNVRSRAASTCRARAWASPAAISLSDAAEGCEFRCTPLWLVRRQRLFSKNVARPSDQLVDRPAQLPGEVTAHTHREVEHQQAQSEYRGSETGVVIPGVSLGPLHPAQCAIELPEVRGERLSLGWTKPG